MSIALSDYRMPDYAAPIAHPGLRVRDLETINVAVRKMGSVSQASRCAQISRSYLSNILNGHRNRLRADMALALARYTQTPLAALFDCEEVLV